MRLKYKIWLDNDGKAFGEGPYQLLMGVKSSGSLAQAAKDLNMSYSRAHGLMKYLSKQLGFALIESQAGGAGGGGTRITAQAEDLMLRYDSFIKESADSLEKIFARHFAAEAGQQAAGQSSPNPPAPKRAEEPSPAPAGGENNSDRLTRQQDKESIYVEKIYGQPLESAQVKLPLKLKPLQLVGRDVVALTGGGGKTSLMYALAEELSVSGAKVILTTTTRILLPNHGTVHRLVVSGEQGIISLLQQGMAAKEIVALGSGVREGKLLGLTPELVDRLADLMIADYILVEADGAAMKAFKAPAAHEPVIPQSSTLVLNVVGLDALNAPLTEEYFQRVGQISAICGLPPGAPMDGAAIAAVMCSDAGGRKQLPRGAHWLPVINKTDSEDDYPQAEQIAQALARAGAREALLTSTLNHKLRMVLWGKSEA